MLGEVFRVARGLRPRRPVLTNEWPLAVSPQTFPGHGHYPSRGRDPSSAFRIPYSAIPIHFPRRAGSTALLVAVITSRLASLPRLAPHRLHDQPPAGDITITGAGVDIWGAATVSSVEFGYREGMEAVLKDLEGQGLAKRPELKAIRDILEHQYGRYPGMAVRDRASVLRGGVIASVLAMVRRGPGAPATEALAPPDTE